MTCRGPALQHWTRSGDVTGPPPKQAKHWRPSPAHTGPLADNTVRTTSGMCGRAFGHPGWSAGPSGARLDPSRRLGERG